MLSPILFARHGMDLTVSNVLPDHILLEPFAHLLMPVVQLGILKMVNVLAAIVDSTCKDQHAFNRQLHQGQVRVLTSIVLEQIQEDYVSDVSMDLLYKMEPVWQISRTLLVEETQLSVETDGCINILFYWN
jgi:hypothetical protein